jgi:FAD-dependent urate hydroxylase
VRVAVVGLGMAGSTLACLLADRGVDVVVLEQEDDPRPVGAGIWLQHMGQQEANLPAATIKMLVISQ